MARSKNFAARGLESLSSNDADFEALFAARDDGRVASIQNIPLTRIDPNPFQARHVFEDIDELASAIQTHGFVTRIRVRPSTTAQGHYQLVYGERRLRAAQMAGLTEIPCEIVQQTDDEMIEIGLAENIHRRNLLPLEEAEAFRMLIDRRGYTHADLAERIGKNRSYVEDRLALLRMPGDVQEMVEQRPHSLRAAREIAKLPDAAVRQPLIEAVTSDRVNQQDVRVRVREAKRLVGSEAGRSQAEQRETAAQATDGVESRFSRMLARDSDHLRTMCSRWRQSLRTLSGDERAQLLALIQHHLDEIEQLKHQLH